MNEFQAEIEATEEKRGRSILCRYCNRYHPCNEDGVVEGACWEERERKRLIQDPLRYALRELPETLWPKAHEVLEVHPLSLEELALIVESAAEQAEAEGHRFDAACDWIDRWMPILRELRRVK